MRGVIACVVTLALLVLTVATVVHVAPSVEVCSVKALVFHAVASPPAPACLITKLRTVRDDPRSTRSHFEDASEQNLSVVPPETLPLTAFAALSLALHTIDPVAGRLSARLAPTVTTLLRLAVAPSSSVAVSVTV